MQVALLGAGHIGQTIARLLPAAATTSVTVVDRERGRARAARRRRHRDRRRSTPNDPPRCAAALRGHDAVINALPYHLAIAAGDAGARGRLPLLRPDRGRGRHARDQGAGRRRAHRLHAAVRAGAGLHRHRRAPPGASPSTTLHDVKMRVGALPAFPTNALKYNLTWSVDGLINEYCHPCEAIRDGAAHRGAAARGPGALLARRHRVRGLQHLAAAWARCARRWPARVRNLDYKTCATPATAR